MEKAVTLSLEEYNQLLQDQEDKNRLLDEIEKEADQRGYLVREITQVYMKENGWFEPSYNSLREKSKVEIKSKDVVLKEAQEEIDRLSKLCMQHRAYIDYLLTEKKFLDNRGIFKRILNTSYQDDMYERFKLLHIYEYRD